MDKQQIIEKFKKEKHHVPLLRLDRGDVVIGTEVDENNQLHYVLEKNGEIVIEKASGKKITERFVRPQPKRITVDTKNI